MSTMDDPVRPEPRSFNRPFFSRFLLPRFNAASMAAGEGQYREQLFRGLAGRVIEVGAGSGLNFAYYPREVTEVLAVEPEQNLREVAAQKALAAPVSVRVSAGVGDELPAADSTFDAAIVSLVLCSVPDQARTLAEIRRVLAPGGELRFFEHVRAENPVLAATQTAVTPVWCRLGGGCHLNRRTEHAIEAAGFTIEKIERFEFAPGRLEKLGGPHILGIARA
jgi:ubiquinone/menaquinone biosynthesis C-methylase UbiE